MSLQAEKEHFQNMKYKPNLNLSEMRQSSADDSEATREQRKKQAEKVNNYAKYVKEMYWPKVSPRKQLELEQVKESLKSANVRRST